MELKTNVPLAPYTTFYIGGPAAYFCDATTAPEVAELVVFAQEKNIPWLILGEGSNVLVSDEGYRGLVIRLRNTGIKILEENDHSILLEVMSGEHWDDVVKYAVDRDLWGIENLSHIPGTMGAFAVQNVGAYGQEASEVVARVMVLNTESRKIETLENQDCNFSYRHSIFNTSQKGKYIILATELQLNKQPAPKLEYGDLKKYLIAHEIVTPTQKQIRIAITAIRDKKFPYPDGPQNGNTGSFFRGPIISPENRLELFKKVEQNFGNMALDKLQSLADRLTVAQGMKTPTGFLIELCGFKNFGYRGAIINPDHAASILNASGTATARGVLQLFKIVQTTVQNKTGVVLHIEPELIGFPSDYRP